MSRLMIARSYRRKTLNLLSSSVDVSSKDLDFWIAKNAEFLISVPVIGREWILRISMDGVCIVGYILKFLGVGKGVTFLRNVENKIYHDQGL